MVTETSSNCRRTVIKTGIETVIETGIETVIEQSSNSHRTVIERSLKQSNRLRTVIEQASSRHRTVTVQPLKYDRTAPRRRRTGVEQE